MTDIATGFIPILPLISISMMFMIIVNSGLVRILHKVLVKEAPAKHR